MSRTDDQGRRLCTATAKSTGLPCRAPAVSAATVCRLHGAAKGTPARAAADQVLLTELIGPALTRLKGLVESRTTADGVLLAAIREILDRTGYSETLRPTLAQIEDEIDRLIEEAEAELTVLGLDGRA